MNRLVIIDGNAILHRAYHAIPPLSTPDGTPTNAVYGFTTMLLKLYADLKPTHLAVAFDRPAPTFRKKLYAEYQSTRPKMDDELSVQVALAHDVVAALGIPIYEKDGYEADDLIGTIVARLTKSADSSADLGENDEKQLVKPKQSRQHADSQDSSSQALVSNVNHQTRALHNSHVIIVTGDRDMLQLVRKDRVFVYMPVKGLSQSQLFDEQKTREKLGVAPESVVTLKALMGDSSDNYPGVAGIGPKTARELVTMFGSLEKIYEACDRNDGRISPSVQEKLRNGRKDAFLSRTLATIKEDVPVAVDFPGMQVSTLDTPQAHKTFNALRFGSLVDRLGRRQQDQKQNTRKKTTNRVHGGLVQQELF